MRPSTSRPSSRRPPTAPPKVHLERNADSLRELRSADTTFRQVDLCLGHRGGSCTGSPGGSPIRPAAEFSLLERIRRFEASARQH